MQARPREFALSVGYVVKSTLAYSLSWIGAPTGESHPNKFITTPSVRKTLQQALVPRITDDWTQYGQETCGSTMKKPLASYLLTTTLLIFLPSLTHGWELFGSEFSKPTKLYGSTRIRVG